MTSFSRLVLVSAIGSVLLFAATISTLQAATGLDVYVVYSGKDRKIKSDLEKLLSKSISTKFYNVDLLAVADYSGKQKAIVKLERASIVVVLNDAAARVLDGVTFKNTVVLAGIVGNSVQSQTQAVRILDQNNDLTSLGNVKSIKVSRTEELEDQNKLSGVDVIRIDQTKVSLATALSKALSTLLRSR